MQECFAYLGQTLGSFPESERAAAETLALPIHPELTEPQAKFVVDCIREFFATQQAAARAFAQTAVVATGGQSK